MFPLPEAVVISTDRFHPQGKFEMMGTLEDALEFLKILKGKASAADSYLAAARTQFFIYRFEAESVEYPEIGDLAAAAGRPPIGRPTKRG